MLNRGVVAFVAVVAGLVAVSGAQADTYRMVDGSGGVHLTNAPADPRYRGLPVVSGTATGWLRMTETSHSQYATEIREISARHGVDANLVESVIRAESAFNPTAVSRTGARGLMQLMPKTAQDLKVNNSFDPAENIRGGVRYLRFLLDTFKGDVSLAVAAYNAGLSKVARYGGIPPYEETRNYVSRVMSYRKTFQGE